MNRSADWFHQAQADLAQAQLSADAGHHEWAYYASATVIRTGGTALGAAERSALARLNPHPWNPSARWQEKTH